MSVNRWQKAGAVVLLLLGFFATQGYAETQHEKPGSDFYNPDFVLTETEVALEIPAPKPAAKNDDTATEAPPPRMVRFAAEMRSPHFLAQDVLMHVESPMSKKAEFILWQEPETLPLITIGKRFDQLDMLIIDESGKVTQVLENFAPADEPELMPDGVVKALLLLGPGTIQRYGIRPGTRVHHPALGG